MGALSQPARNNLADMRLRALSETYIDARRQILDRLERRLGKPALRLTETDLDNYQRHYLPADPASRRVELSHICGFFRWALTQKLIRTDPTSLIVMPKTARRLPRPISEADLKVALDNAPARVYPWLVLAAYAGLRACEVAGLNRSDVLDAADPPVLLIHGKGSKDRIVPANRTVMDALTMYGLPSHGPVFLRADGKPGRNTASNLDTVANRYLRSVGVSARFHRLRHAFATQIYRETHDLLLVSALLGHSDPSTTAGYAAYASEDAASAVASLDRGRRLVVLGTPAHDTLAG